MADILGNSFANTYVMMFCSTHVWLCSDFHYVIFLMQELKPAVVEYAEEMDVEYLEFPIVNVRSEVMNCFVIIIQVLFLI